MSQHSSRPVDAAKSATKGSYYCSEDARTEEHKRLAESENRVADWKLLGPYVSERAWGEN